MAALSASASAPALTISYQLLAQQIEEENGEENMKKENVAQTGYLEILNQNTEKSILKTNFMLRKLYAIEPICAIITREVMQIEKYNISMPEEKSGRSCNPEEAMQAKRLALSLISVAINK